jgi:hypothetical protein
MINFPWQSTFNLIIKKNKIHFREHEELTYKKEEEAATKRAFHGTNQIISSLENRTHQISMSMMEAEHLRKKYRTIRAGLMQVKLIVAKKSGATTNQK